MEGVDSHSGLLAMHGLGLARGELSDYVFVCNRGSECVCLSVWVCVCVVHVRVSMHMCLYVCVHAYAVLEVGWFFQGAQLVQPQTQIWSPQRSRSSLQNKGAFTHLGKPQSPSPAQLIP